MGESECVSPLLSRIISSRSTFLLVSLCVCDLFFTNHHRYLFNNNAALKDFNDSQFPVTSVSLLVVLISAFILTTAMPLYFAVFTPPPPTVTIDQIKTLPALLETPEGYACVLVVGVMLGLVGFFVLGLLLA